ncbi:MAG: hypothetical protein RLZZ305_36 [Actinomycetota bacterium]
MMLSRWGATDEEVAAPVTGDEFLPDARLVATRAITVAAPPDKVFPWLRQLGFGRAGWYSYDVIDNLGRRSARTILAEWQGLSEGDAVPGGPVDFEAVVVDPPRALVLRLGRGPDDARRVRFVLAYELHGHPTGTRLVTRVRASVNVPFGRLVERFLLGPGDGIMLRRQLLGVRRRAESAPT